MCWLVHLYNVITVIHKVASRESFNATARINATGRIIARATINAATKLKATARIEATTRRNLSGSEFCRWW